MAGHRPWSTIKDGMSPERRAGIAARAEALRLGMVLGELRKEAGLTQQELAQRLGITQPALSQMEAGDDMHVATLRKIVAELGGDVVLHMPNGDVSLSGS